MNQTQSERSCWVGCADVAGRLKADFLNIEAMQLVMQLVLKQIHIRYQLSRVTLRRYIFSMMLDRTRVTRLDPILSVIIVQSRFALDALKIEFILDVRT